MARGSEPGPRHCDYFSQQFIYISGKKIDLSQRPNLTIHSDILRISWLSMILGIIPTSLALTQQTYFTHIGSKKLGLKWASQLITKIWRLVYGQWLHHSKIKHTGEAFDNHGRALILDAEITDEHKRGQDTLPDLYNPYFGMPFYIILDTSIMARKVNTT